jgi:hypothetical protein
VVQVHVLELLSSLPHLLGKAHENVAAQWAKLDHPAPGERLDAFEKQISVSRKDVKTERLQRHALTAGRRVQVIQDYLFSGAQEKGL